MMLCWNSSYDSVGSPCSSHSQKGQKQALHLHPFIGMSIIKYLFILIPFTSSRSTTIYVLPIKVLIQMLLKSSESICLHLPLRQCFTYSNYTLSKTCYLSPESMASSFRQLCQELFLSIYSTKHPPLCIPLLHLIPASSNLNQTCYLQVGFCTNIQF